jgi:hypothetical protein
MKMSNRRTSSYIPHEIVERTIREQQKSGTFISYAATVGQMLHEEGWTVRATSCESTLTRGA